MFGFLTSVEPGPQPGQPNHWYQSLSLAASRWTGHPHHNAMLWAAIASVLSLVFLWKTPARQPILFGLIACAATWLPMVLTAGAGKAAQHVILLWPFHLIPIAAVLAQIPAAPRRDRDRSVVRLESRGDQSVLCRPDRATAPRSAGPTRWIRCNRYLIGSARRANLRRRLGIYRDHESAERRRTAYVLRRHRQRPGHRGPAARSFERIRRAHGRDLRFIRGSAPLSRMWPGASITRKNRSPPSRIATGGRRLTFSDSGNFTCNICGGMCERPTTPPGREVPGCPTCGSTVRLAQPDRTALPRNLRRRAGASRFPRAQGRPRHRHERSAGAGTSGWRKSSTTSTRSIIRSRAWIS